MIELRKYSIGGSTMTKRVLSIFLVIALLVTAMPISASAATTVASGTCGPNAKWYISGKTLVIHGSGDMYDYGTDSAPWENYICSGNTSTGADIISIQIGDQITSIGDYAFYNNMGIESITFGSSVKRIGKHSCNFEHVEKLSLPEGLQVIDDYAFAWSYNLKEVNLPSSLEVIGDGAFYSCNKLSSVHIPAKVNKLGSQEFTYKSGVFGHCFSMNAFSVDPANSAFTAQDGVLFTKDLTHLIQYPLGADRLAYSVPNGVKTIGYGSFGYCSKLQSIDIPSSVTNIQEYAFYYSPTLKKITFQGNAPQINASSIFHDDKLTAYYPFGNSTWTADVMQNYTGNITWVAYIDPELTTLASGTCGDNLTWFLTEDGTLTISGTGPMYSYSFGMDYPWYEHLKKVKYVIIEDGITVLPSYAFECMTEIQTVTLPSTLEVLPCNAFNTCSKLRDLIIPASVKEFVSGKYFNRCDVLTDVYYMGTPEEWANVANNNVVGSQYDNVEAIHFLVISEQKATCTEPGIEPYYQFDDTSIHGGYFDVNKQPIPEPIVAPALGHAYEYVVDATPTLSKQGTISGTCSRCSHTVGIALPALNTADYTYSVIQEPTYSAAGIGRYTWNTTTYGTFYFDVTLDKLVEPTTAPWIIVESKDARPGETVTVTISVKNNPGITSMKLNVAFDDMLTLTDVVYNASIGGQYMPPISLGSPVILNWFNGLNDAEGDWTFVTLTFVVAEDAVPGATANITVTYDENDLFDSTESNVVFGVENGHITIADYTPGDITGDGEVNNKDVTRLFRYLSGYEVDVDEAALDVNGDGEVNNKDLTRLFKYVSGYDVTIN